MDFEAVVRNLLSRDEVTDEELCDFLLYLDLIISGESELKNREFWPEIKSKTENIDLLENYIRNSFVFSSDRTRLLMFCSEQISLLVSVLDKYLSKEVPPERIALLKLCLLALGSFKENSTCFSLLKEELRVKKSQPRKLIISKDFDINSDLSEAISIKRKFNALEIYSKEGITKFNLYLTLLDIQEAEFENISMESLKHRYINLKSIERKFVIPEIVKEKIEEAYTYLVEELEIELQRLRSRDFFSEYISLNNQANAICCQQSDFSKKINNLNKLLSNAKIEQSHCSKLFKHTDYLDSPKYKGLEESLDNLNRLISSIEIDISKYEKLNQEYERYNGLFLEICTYTESSMDKYINDSVNKDRIKDASSVKDRIKFLQSNLSLKPREKITNLFTFISEIKKEVSLKHLDGYVGVCKAAIGKKSSLEIRFEEIIEQFKAEYHKIVSMPVISSSCKV